MKTKVLTLLLVVSAIITSCSKDDEGTSLSLKKSEINLYSLEKENIIVQPSADGCSFKSENSLIAKVTPSGEVTGMTIGTTNVLITNPSNNFKANCKITVNPKYNLFKEPCLDFGATKSQIKSKETRTLLSETSTGLAFKGENPYVSGIMYIFDSNGRMSGASFLAPLVPTSNTEKLLGFVVERYFMVEYDMSKEIFFIGISSNEKIGIGLRFYEGTSLMSIYTQLNSTLKSQTIDDEYVYNQIVDLLKK